MEQGDVTGIKKTPQQAFVDRLVAENTALKQRNEQLETLLDELTTSAETLERQKLEVIEQWKILKEDYDQVIKELKQLRQAFKNAKEEYALQKKNYRKEMNDLFKQLK